jgi:hypothetical protein
VLYRGTRAQEYYSSSSVVQGYRNSVGLPGYRSSTGVQDYINCTMSSVGVVQGYMYT